MALISCQNLHLNSSYVRSLNNFYYITVISNKITERQTSTTYTRDTKISPLKPLKGRKPNNFFGIDSVNKYNEELKFFHTNIPRIDKIRKPKGKMSSLSNFPSSSSELVLLSLANKLECLICSLNELGVTFIYTDPWGDLFLSWGRLLYLTRSNSLRKY